MPPPYSLGRRLQSSSAASPPSFSPHRHCLKRAHSAVNSTYRRRQPSVHRKSLDSPPSDPSSAITNSPPFIIIIKSGQLPLPQSPGHCLQPSPPPATPPSPSIIEDQISCNSYPSHQQSVHHRVTNSPHHCLLQPLFSPFNRGPPVAIHCRRSSP